MRVQRISFFHRDSLAAKGRDMVVIRCLFVGIFICLTAFILGWEPSTSGAASYGFDQIDELIFSAPISAPGYWSSQWREFWFSRGLNISTINSLDSPMLCGRPFAYLLNIVVVVVFIIGAAFYVKATPVGRLRIVTGTGTAILILWLVYDLRETYSQFKTMEEIYQSYVKLSQENKTFPSMGDFYRFVDLCQNVIPPDGQFHFYSDPDWPYDCRIHYFLYPRRMTSRAYGSNIIDTKTVPYHVVYKDPHIRYDPGEHRLLYSGPNGTYFVSKVGAIVATFNRNSFIFLEGEALQ